MSDDREDVREDHRYEPRSVQRQFMTYEKDAELPVSIDLVVNGVTSRQTDAIWRYDYLQNHADRREIQGLEQIVTALVAERSR